MLYFAYGSNMSVRRLRARVPSAVVQAVAALHGHDLRFHKKSTDGSGKCDAYETHDPAHSVFGVVFEINESDKATLDRIEGRGCGYEQKEATLTAFSGETILAMTYYATSIDPALRPYGWYKHHVLTGARENALPGEYIEKIKTIQSIPDPEPERHLREMALYVNS